MKTAIKTITSGEDERIPPRDRILAAAADLFYRHGIRAVGVDSIAEAAGTNKMTLRARPGTSWQHSIPPIHARNFVAGSRTWRGTSPAGTSVDVR